MWKCALYIHSPPTHTWPHTNNTPFLQTRVGGKERNKINRYKYFTKYLFCFLSTLVMGDGQLLIMKWYLGVQACVHVVRG